MFPLPIYRTFTDTCRSMLACSENGRLSQSGATTTRATSGSIHSQSRADKIMPTGTNTRELRRSQRSGSKAKVAAKSTDDNDDDDEDGIPSKPPKKKSRQSTSTATSHDDDTISSADEVRNVKEEDDDGDEEETAEAITTEDRKSHPKEPTSPSSIKHKHESSEAGEDSADGHSIDTDDDIPKTRPKGASTKKVQKRGSIQNRTCPHCNKVISTRAGLKYHVDNFVCRKDQADKPPDHASPAKRKRGKSNSGGSGKKRLRGPIEARTCPKCLRVFTSDFGCKYHIKHKVCQTAPGNQETNTTGLESLPPGAKFITPFGVVEVVKDDREQPSGSLPPGIKDESKKYQALRTRIEGSNAKLMEAIASNLRCRRDKINALYERKMVTKRSVLKIYFSGNPRIVRNGKNAIVFRPLPKDPALPSELCPDRIVECILIPDQRARFTSTNVETPADIRPGTISLPQKSPTRLFLQRKLLKEPYDEGTPIYSCATCGRTFNSLPGLRYHDTAKVCAQKQISDHRSRTLRQEKIEKAAQQLAEGASQLRDLVPQSTHANKDTRKRKKKKKETAMYPEVLLSLGYKVIKEDMIFTEDIKLPPPIGGANSEGQDLMGTEQMDTDEEGPWREPGAVLQSLKEQLETHKRDYLRSAADQKHGTMYLAVFKALGYKRGKPGKKILVVRASKRKRRCAKPPPPPKPAPPIIDTRALADEVDAGRYPSMKRYTEGFHGDICFACRDGGELICCNFCKNAEHLKCIRIRFTVKDPEPEDDFMCHRCIQYILGRRNRAERRRLEKQQREEHRRQQEALEETKKNPGIRKGMEYPYLAARGQEITELVELLKDAQTRLEQSLATSKMNTVRRKAMGCFYSKK